MSMDTAEKGQMTPDAPKELFAIIDKATGKVVTVPNYVMQAQFLLVADKREAVEHFLRGVADAATALGRPSPSSNYAIRTYVLKEDSCRS